MEVLVVGGIIGVLIAMLMPALSAARALSQEVHCQSKLHQIGVAAVNHQLDHRGYLPIAGWHWEPIGGVVNAAGLGDPQARRYVYYDDDDGVKRPAPVTAALALSMGVDVSLHSRPALAEDLEGDDLRKYFTCPSQHPLLSGVSQTSSEGWRTPPEWSSYVFNEALLGRRHPKEFPDCPAGHATRVKSPSTVLLAMDGRPRNQTGDNYPLATHQGYNDSLLDFHRHVMGPDNKYFGYDLLDFLRHRWRANVLFVDGHVESVHLSDGGLDSIGVSKGIYQ